MSDKGIKYYHSLNNVNEIAINGILIILLVFGLASGFLFSLNLDLNSDTVVPGLVAMEIANHGNFLFSYPVDDPYLFTDIFTFYFLPQVISGYDPTVLRLTAFGVFILVVAIFSYLVYKFSSVTNALIFAALTANLQPGVAYLFLSPEYHVGTLLFAGIFLLVFHTDIIKKLPFYAVIAISLVVGLIVISDSFIIAIFVLPYLIYCLYQLRMKKDGPKTDAGKNELPGSKKKRASKAAILKKETSRMYQVLILLAISTVVAYELKMNNFFSKNLHMFFITTKSPSLGGSCDKFALFLSSLVQLLNNSLFNLVTRGICWYDLIIAAIFALIVAYSLLKANKKAGYLYSIYIFSAIGVLAAFLFTTIGEEGSGRFLILIAVAVFSTIALAYKPEKPGLNLNTLYLAAITILILTTAIANITQISGYDYQPNKEDYALVCYMEQNNLTYGFSDYWTGNVVIYLSKEKLLVPNAQVCNNSLYVTGMLTTLRWYDTDLRNEKICLMTKETEKYFGEVQELNTVQIPIKTYTFGEHIIYQYNTTDCPIMQNIWWQDYS